MAEQHAPPEHLLTPAEVAALVFVDPKTVSRWAKAGKLPATRTPGGHRRFRRSDVQPLIPRDSGRDWLPDESAGPLFEKAIERKIMAAAGYIDRATADAAIAQAVAHALEAQTESPADAVQESAASLALAADAAARAAVKARLITAFAATQTALDAVRVAASVQADADAASADAALAAARVARAVTDTATHVAMVVAAFELYLDPETAPTAEAQNVTVETAPQ
jgi:excisionase family DNA binding protein